MDRQQFLKYEAIFHPRSVAVAGASGDRKKMGTAFFQSLLNSGFQGEVYPVNSTGGDILGVKSYPTVSAIPGPVDYVIVSVPANSILELLEDCASKGVKAVQIFTAGFREGGTTEGRKMESAMVKIASKGGFHIIGPNCVGICNSSNGFNPLYLPMKKTGPVAVIAQSGSITGRTTQRALARGVQFSKIVSYGNGCDLDSSDFLEYFTTDPDTEIIGLYIEGTGEGRRLFELLREVCKTKPVVIWKGGKTETGSEVTMSHTGSLAIPDAVWKALLKQVEAVEVGNMEELVDTLLAFYCLREFKGNGMGILCGILGGGGGEGVVSTDICSSLGLEVPRFSTHTREKLMSILPAEGRIFRNPLDFGTPVENVDIVKKALGTVAVDPGVDLIIFHNPIYEMCVDSFGPFGGWAQDVNDALIQLKREQSKPVVVISPPGLPTTKKQWELEKELSEAGIPVYPNIQQAAKAIAAVSRYFHSIETDENL